MLIDGTGPAVEHRRLPAMRATEAFHSVVLSVMVACSPDGRDPAHDRGLEALTSWDAIPILDDGAFQTDSSYDRTLDPFSNFAPGNKDFNNFIAVCGARPELWGQHVDGVTGCAPGLEGYLVASDDTGPGYVSRIFLSVGQISSGALDHEFHDEVIRVYVDDLGRPAYEGRLRDWISGDAPFAPPAVSWVSGALTSYVPVSYQSRVRILLDHLEPSYATYFFQVDRHSSAETLAFDKERYLPDAVAGRALSTAFAPPTSGDASIWTDQHSIVPAGSTVNVLDQPGPATLDRLTITIDAASVDILAGIVLRAFWDDETSPAIEVPLSSLSSMRFVVPSLDTAPMSVHTDGQNALGIRLSLPMPFSSRARLSLENTGGKAVAVGVRAEGMPGVPKKSWGRLHAREYPAAVVPAGTPYRTGELRGRGKYAGTSLSILSTTDPAAVFQDPLNALEYDPSAIIDGRLVHLGTGTEEYLDGGWYFPSGPYSEPFSGVTDVESYAATSSGRISGVKWHVLSSAIPFADSFHLEFESADIERTLAAASFYYVE